MEKSRKLMFFGILFIVIVLVYSCQVPPQDNHDNERILEQQNQELRDALSQAQLDLVNQPDPVAPIIPDPPNQRPEILVLEPDTGEEIRSDNFPIRWTASDRDNDQLSITLEFRRENSASFVPIADSLSNSGQFVWDVSGITDGTFTLKATVTDGELEDSDTTGVFNIDRN